MERAISSSVPNIHFKRKKRSEMWFAIAFILPASIFFILMVLLPLAQAIQLGFFDWDGLKDSMSFVGLQNYVGIWVEPRFIWSLIRTLIWWFLHVGFAVSTGLLLAVLITQVKWGRNYFRTLTFLPHVMSLSVVGIIWSQLYHPTIGLTNKTLEAIGLGFFAKAWLGDALLALPSISVASSWQAYGFYMVIFIAALQNIDPELYEAAMVDGANSWNRFLNITLPGLYNTMTLVLTLAFINSLKGFGTVWAMTGGGPVNSSELASVYVWRTAFQTGSIGRAAAAGIIIGVIVIVISSLFNHWRDKER